MKYYCSYSYKTYILVYTFMYMCTNATGKYLIQAIWEILSQFLATFL